MVDYPSVGRLTAVLLANARYRLRHDEADCILEGDQGGGNWEHSRVIASEAIGLDRSTVYVLSHNNQVPCGFVMERRGAAAE